LRNRSCISEPLVAVVLEPFRVEASASVALVLDAPVFEAAALAGVDVVFEDVRLFRAEMALSPAPTT
jgi:hypothetical protein